MTIRLVYLTLCGFLLLGGCDDGRDEDRRLNAPRASARGVAAHEKPFLASILREPFHRADCRWAAKISERNLVGYDSREDALADDHRPCKECQP